MTAPRCPEHDVPIRNATLCPKCLWDVERDLGDIPALVDELDLTLSRQDRIELTGSSTLDPDFDDNLPLTAKVQALAYNANASTVGDDLNATLAGWVNDINTTAKDFPPADTSTSRARWLQSHLNDIAQHPKAEQLRDEIAYAVSSARHAVDRPVERVFAGPCLEPISEVGKCPADLYAIPGRDTVRCRGCGAVHNVEERRAWLLAEAEDRLETAPHISQALSGLGMAVKYDRIRKWRERGRLIPHGVDFDGRDLYRIGDVIELLAADREKEVRRAG